MIVLLALVGFSNAKEKAGGKAGRSTPYTESWRGPGVDGAENPAHDRVMK